MLFQGDTWHSPATANKQPISPTFFSMAVTSHTVRTKKIEFSTHGFDHRTNAPSQPFSKTSMIVVQKVIQPLRSQRFPVIATRPTLLQGSARQHVSRSLVFFFFFVPGRCEITIAHRRHRRHHANSIDVIYKTLCSPNDDPVSRHRRL